MFEKYSCRITGVAPLILHSGQLADPLNDYAKEMKKISGKRHKTEADLEELARLEWHGSLYLSEGQVVIPGEVLEAHLVEAAKKRKKGQQAKASLFCDGVFPLVYDGPGDVHALWQDGAYRLTTGVKVQRNRIMRTRPYFESWALSAQVLYNPSQLNLSEIQDFSALAASRSALEIGGRALGAILPRPCPPRWEMTRATPDGALQRRLSDVGGSGSERQNGSRRRAPAAQVIGLASCSRQGLVRRGGMRCGSSWCGPAWFGLARQGAACHGGARARWDAGWGSHRVLSSNCEAGG
jgi:hypothetical protein